MAPPTGRLAVVAIVSLMAAVTWTSPAAAAVPFQSIGLPAGPLSTIAVGNELSCQVGRSGDASFSFYPSTQTPGDCGTFAFVDGILFAPNFASHGSTAAGGLGAYTPFTPVSQPAAIGAGTPADPTKVVTTANLGPTGIQIVETDSYVAGQEYYTTKVTLNNGSGADKNVILYRAGDCYMVPGDSSFGFSSAANGVGCSATAFNAPSGRVVAFTPQSAGASFTEDTFSAVWGKIGAHTSLTNDCAKCANLVDSGIGISWSLVVPAGGTASRDSAAGVSPAGVPPPAQPDADSDGVPDAQDECPTEAGTGVDGCPPPTDTDSDGVPDAQDGCPTQAGTEPNGCPPNGFTIGKPKRNRKKGTATLSVTVPGAGELTLNGEGVKPQRPVVWRRAGVDPKPVAAAGTIELTLKAAGKAKKRLKRKGKVKVTPTLTFTPTGGQPATQTITVKLIRKRKGAGR